MVSRFPVALMTDCAPPIHWSLGKGFFLRGRVGVAIVIWALASLAVWVWAANYEFSNEQPRADLAQRQWPTQSELPLASDRSTLVLFVHPKCPCTRATIRELQKILTPARLKTAKQPAVLVLAAHPADVPKQWCETDILRGAARLPRARVILDPQGKLTNRFGVVSSGTVMLFEPGGEPLFAGGVTVSRGHEGDSVAGQALVRALKGQEPLERHSHPVFGCRLCLPEPSPHESAATRAEVFSSPGVIPFALEVP